MIQFSSVVLFLGLQYHEMSLDTGAQTTRLGWAGPVSYVLGGMTLTGCFFLSRRSSKAKPDTSPLVPLIRRGGFFLLVRRSGFFLLVRRRGFSLVASLLQLQTSMNSSFALVIVVLHS